MSDVPPNETQATPDAEPASEAPRSGLISSSSAPGNARTAEVWSDLTPATPAATSIEPQGGSTSAAPTIELSDIEARVLGAMIEKSFLTPDVYPMTTNAMVTACNQKTNRDPVVDYSAVIIDSTLIELRQRNLVRRVHTPGSRSTKHRQTLDEALSLSDAQLALISVLLLRGPQTVGELRLRTERHDVGFDDLDAVESCLNGLQTRTRPLVRELPRKPGHKENRWQHLLGDPHADVGEAATAVPERPATVAPTAPPTAAPAVSAAPAGGQANDLSARIDSLESEVATLRRQLASLAEKLGEPLE